MTAFIDQLLIHPKNCVFDDDEFHLMINDEIHKISKSIQVTPILFKFDYVQPSFYDLLENKEEGIDIKTLSGIESIKIDAIEKISSIYYEPFDNNSDEHQIKEMDKNDNEIFEKFIELLNQKLTDNNLPKFDIEQNVEKNIIKNDFRSSVTILNAMDLADEEFALSDMQQIQNIYEKLVCFISIQGKKYVSLSYKIVSIFEEIGSSLNEIFPSSLRAKKKL